MTGLTSNESTRAQTSEALQVLIPTVHAFKVRQTASFTSHLVSR